MLERKPCHGFGRRLNVWLVLLLLAGTDATAAELPFAPRATVGERQLELVGSGVLRFGLVIDVYAAALYSGDDADVSQLLSVDTVKRLELEYFRAFEREQIITAAEKILRRQLGEQTFNRLRPALNDWHASLRGVQPGDRYVMEYDGQEMRLILNGDLVARSLDTRLAAAYFGIWLADGSINSGLRSQLLGVPS